MAYPIPEPAPEFVTALITEGKFVQKIWPDQTTHLFPEGEQRPLVVPAKLRPLIVLSRRSEMQMTGAALVVPCSRWNPADFGDQASRLAANELPHLHWIRGSQVFRMISACIVDFRWTYRLPVAQLQKARLAAAPGFPRGPVARLTNEAIEELLQRFRAYLS